METEKTPITDPVQDIVAALYRYEDSIASIFGKGNPPWPVKQAYAAAKKYLAWPSGSPNFREDPTLVDGVKSAYALKKLRVAAKHLAYLNAVILNAGEERIEEVIKKWKGESFDHRLTSTNPRQGSSGSFYNGL